MESPYYFYSGNKCHKFFTILSNVVDSDSKSNSSATETSDSTTSTCNAASNPILKAYKLTATQIEMGAQSEY